MNMEGDLGVRWTDNYPSLLYYGLDMAYGNSTHQSVPQRILVKIHVPTSRWPYVPMPI